MSMTDTTSFDAGETQADTSVGTVDDGTPAVVDAPGGVDAPAPVAEALDFDAFGNHTVSVTVDGETLSVPLSELRSGYSRQADYTRKTQELAERQKRLSQADALAAALDQDPHRVIQTLMDTYNFRPQGAAVDQGPSWDDMDPVERRLAEVDQRVQGFEQQQLQARINAEIESIQAQDPNVDIDAVVAHAIRKDTDLTTAYRDMNYDALQAQLARQQQEQAVVEQKRAAQVVSGGSSAQRGSLTPATQGKAMSVRDSWRAALKELGVAS